MPSVNNDRPIPRQDDTPTFRQSRVGSQGDFNKAIRAVHGPSPLPAPPPLNPKNAEANRQMDAELAAAAKANAADAAKAAATEEAAAAGIPGIVAGPSPF